jgi:ABC-2 type transport system permease protein
LLPFSLALPLTYGYDAVRGWLLGTRTMVPLGWEFIILIVFMFLMVFLGLRAFYALERRVRIKGTLGQY